MMERLLTIAGGLERFSTHIGRLSAWLSIVLIGVIMTDVVLRRWFVIGSTKLQELEWHLHGFLFLMCLGWAYSKNAHVRIELLSERLSIRSRAWIELGGCALFLLPYVAAVIWFGIDYVAYSLEYNEASPSPTGLTDRWIIKSAIVAGFSVLAVAAVARVLNAVAFLFGAEDIARQTSFHPHETAGER